jgi:hypothetical protein
MNIPFHLREELSGQKLTRCAALATLPYRNKSYYKYVTFILSKSSFLLYVALINK